ncbi:MAG: UDP-N-acetylmuramate dehydrogenase [Planctomycetota bacterium]|nr:UDP-N-acetylmuramate dehydrogenase [Planctomycetota bacterium]
MMRLLGPFSGLEEYVTENVPLARYTWIKLGGPARWFVRPRTLEELQEAARRCVENQIPIYVIGLGANLIVSDEGVNGAVFRLSEEYWRSVEFNEGAVKVGAGVDMQKLLLKAVRAGRAGLECLAGIPATVAGGIRMNAGGKYGSIGTLVSRVTVMDTEGTVFEQTKDDLVFDYRTCNIVAKFILGATLELEEDDPHRIVERTKEIWMFKRNSQPLNTPNAGCVFKNPGGGSAGQLIDQAGLKGMQIGGAAVSTKHANFIVALQGCKAEHVMQLMKMVRETVYYRLGVLLEPEVLIWP